MHHNVVTHWRAFTGEKPFRRYAIIVDKVGEPCNLEHVSFWALHLGYQVPPVDVVSACESVDTPYYLAGLEKLQRFVEPKDYLLAVCCLHGCYWIILPNFLMKSSDKDLSELTGAYAATQYDVLNEYINMALCASLIDNASIKRNLEFV